MNYIIFDLEWNQPPMEEAAITEPLCLTGEIIEIGAVKLDDDFRLIDQCKLYIRPRYYTKLHRKIASLTHITDRTLEQEGLPFPEAFARFQQWCGEEYSYMTWSLSDLPVLIDNMLLYGMDVSELPDCYDIQRIFLREIMRSNRRVSLDHALEILGIRGDQAHDALHDAKNTALVCDRLDLADYIGEYAARAFADQPQKQPFESRQALLEDEGLRYFPCPWCGETAVCEPWISQSREDFMSMAVCPQGDEFFVHLEILSRGSEYYARRVFYEMSDDLYEVYQDALENLSPIS